jgi:hypothetical protein
MDQTKIIKLIYDKYENEWGILYDENNEIVIDKAVILDNLPTKMNDIDIDVNRLLNIYSWGIKKDRKTVNCDIIFDLTKFQTKIDKDIEIQTITGLTDIIQDSVDNIETMNPKSVGFICNHGKHRSVAWAELLHKLYYKNAKVKHLCRKNWI